MFRTRSLPDRRARFAAAVVSLALASPAAIGQGGAEVRPFSGRYEGRQKLALLTVTAVADIALRRSSRFIVYTMHSAVRWAFIERRFLDCGVVRIEGDRLLPVEYVHRDASNPELDIHTRFDWTAGWAKTTLGRAGEPNPVELGGPTWDPMSFQVALIALAPQRRPGDREHHRVIERGSLKEHEVTFAGAIAPAGDGQPVHEILSRKNTGLIELRLLPDEAWRPARVTIDGVTIELVATPVPAPAILAEGAIPSCEGEGLR